MHAVDDWRHSGELNERERAQQEDHDLSDLLQELRILLQGVQVLTAFLIVVPFSEGFGRIDQIEKWVYLVTFMAAITGLVFVSAPAAQHRLQRPLRDRIGFKHFATRMIVIGMAAFSLALTLAAQLVSNEVVGFGPSIVVAGFVAAIIGAVWWLVPMLAKQNGQGGAPGERRAA